jgi:hypothetical protein
MSAAYKCDRCKLVKDGLSQNSGERIIVKNRKAEDLCDTCTKEFESWYVGGLKSK